MLNRLGIIFTRISLALMLVMGFILPFIEIQPASAATVILVNSTDDSLANDNQCTLREAVIAANKDKPSGRKGNECVAGGADEDIIRLEANMVYMLTRSDSGNEDSSATGDLDIYADITFEVEGSGPATIQAVGFNDRVFQVFSGTVNFSNLIIQGGNLSGDGGAIANYSILNLVDSLVSGNSATGLGGGIYNAPGAELTILSSAVTANSSSSDGGGIANEGTLNMTNSTVSGNTSLGSGGGLFSNGSTTLNSVTVAANSAGTTSGTGGGLAVPAGVTVMRNTILAGNFSSATTPAADCFGSAQSSGYNIVQDPSGCTLTGDLSGNLTDIDPLLGVLADNGGLTPTHAITTDSPAFEAGTCTSSEGTPLTEDQRGIGRPQGLACDIGAFEIVDPIQPGPTYSVTSIFDVTSSTCTFSNCSLRDAILAANNRQNGTTPDKIHFNFSGSGEQTVTLQTPLPAITDTVIIDGFTQPGVTLDGSQLAACTAGLYISASDSTVQGLNIQNFNCDGIGIDGSGNQILENAIFNNTGAGVHVYSGSGNTISENSIYANLAGGIALDADTNNNQSVTDAAVAITRIADAVPSTDVGGELSGQPDSSYTIEVFQNTTCSNAQGELFQTSTTLTTDSSGAGSFLVNIEPPLAQDSGVTLTATGPDGSTSTFSGCTAVGPLNDSWLTAAPLSMTPSGGLNTAAISEKIYQAGQSRWYKFPVSPSGKVEVTVNGLPGVVVTLHSDLLETYKELETPENAGALAANDLPGGYLPGGYLPGGYLPGGYLPGGYLPGGYLPGGYLPGGYLPGGYLPGGYLPGGYLPGGYLPGGYLPGGYLPADYLPGGYLPGGYLPELYSGAVRRSLLALANTGQAEQTIERNTYDLSEDLYVRVSGPASLSDSYEVQVSYQSGICENVPALPEISADWPVIAGSQPPAGSSETLILWDSVRMLADDPTQDIESLRTRLAEFAGRLDILGQVIDLSEQVNGTPVYPRVAQANQISDANPACITAKNSVATEIKNVINAYREANSTGGGSTTLKYIVLAGSDHEIPFFRYPDQAGLASEADYIPPVKDGSASEASLRQAQVLGQDEYGAQYQAARSGYSVPIPQLAVSRLVRTAEQIIGMLDAYEATNGVITPGSALTTGYDFVADAAEKVQTEFNLGLNPGDCAIQPGGCTQVDTLLQPQANGLVGAWSADNLRDKLFPASNNAFDLIFFAGHFSAGSVLAADYSTSINSSELFNNSLVDFTNSLIFALGCHSGYNIPGLDALAFSPTPDWAEAFAEQQATYVAATGYAYGDTDLTEYGESLYLSLSQKLRTGTGPVPIGQALVDSKNDYLAGHVTLEGIDDKTLLETTLYGLPMLKVDFPGQRISESEPSTISSAAPVTSGPGTSLGLQIGQPSQGGAADLIALNTDLSRHEVPLTNALDQTPVTAVYYSGVDGGITARPAEPVFPLERHNAKVDGLILRGVGFRGGTYNDETYITPLTSAATTENSRSHPGFYSDFYYPIQNWGANYYDSIDGTANWLMITPAQYKSTNPGESTGTMRTYQEMDFRLYYLDQDWPNSSDTILKAAAVSASPDIISTNVLSGTNSLHFQVEVIADPAAGVQDVWVTFTSGLGEWHGTWQSLDLQQNTTNTLVWEGDLQLPSGISSDDVHYIVQAANGAGLVSLVDPNLPAAAGVPEIQTELLPTLIDLEPENATGNYNEAGLVTAILLNAVSGQPIQERTLVFAVSDSQGQVVLVQPAITNFEGKASLGALKLPVGEYSLTVYYGSTVNLTGEVVDLTYNTYLGSSASGTITLENSPVAAMDDAYTLQEEEAFNVPAPGVLGNDFDLEGDPLTALLASSPSNGQLALNPDGSFSYTPNQDYYGSDSFSYTVSDGILESAPATVTLTITNVEDAPVANSDVAITEEETSVVINVLDNDLDADNQPLTVTAVTAPANGTAITDGSNVTYTPNLDYYGTDSFSYTVSDGILESAPATVTLTITNVEDAPVANSDAATTEEDTSVVINVLDNDLDVDNQPLTVTAVTAPANGTAVTDGSSVTYTPNPEFSGTDQFEYTLSDGSLSVTSTVSVTIMPVNDNPICTNAVPDTGIWIWPPDNNTFVPVHIEGVFDPEGDPVTITITGIYQDERVKTGGFSPDGMGVGTDTAMVRAERDGNGDGRVYHIFFIASDGNGGSCSVDINTEYKVRVGVFDNQSGGGLDPIDGGALYDSTGGSQGSASIQGGETAMQQPYTLGLVLTGPLASMFAITRRRKAA